MNRKATEVEGASQAIKNEIGEVETSPIKSNGKYSVFQYPSFFAQTTGQN